MHVNGRERTRILTDECECAPPPVNAIRANEQQKNVVKTSQFIVNIWLSNFFPSESEIDRH